MVAIVLVSHSINIVNGLKELATEMAIECLDEEKKDNVKIIDAALVEGTITAAVQSSIGKSVKEIEKNLKPMKLGKIS